MLCAAKPCRRCCCRPRRGLCRRTFSRLDSGRTLTKPHCNSNQASDKKTLIAGSAETAHLAKLGRMRRLGVIVVVVVVVVPAAAY